MRALLLVVLVALGESFSAGTGSSPEEACPVRLAAALRTGCWTVELENVAVNGYTSSDVLARKAPTLAAFRPTYVTLAVGANDIMPGVGPEDLRGHVHAIVAAVLASRVAPANLVGLPQWRRSATDARSDATVESVRSYDAIPRQEIEAAGGRWRRSSHSRPKRPASALASEMAPH